MMYIETREAIREVKSLTKQLTHAQFRQANARAINHTLQKVRTSANREIRKDYKIPLNLVNKGLKIERATPSKPFGMLKANSGFTPLHYFQPRQITASGARMSVTRDGRLQSSAKRVKRVRSTQMQIEIRKGKKQTIRSAFFLPGSTIGLVTARGVYNEPTQFTFRTRRVAKSGPDTPIDVLHTVSVYKSLTTPSVMNSVEKDTMTDYTNRLIHEAKRIIGTL